MVTSLMPAMTYDRNLYYSYKLKAICIQKKKKKSQKNFFENFQETFDNSMLRAKLSRVVIILL